VLDAWGASVGLDAGRYPAVDIDVRDARAAEMLVLAVLRAAPGGVLRVGQAPKALLAYRARAGEPVFKRKIRFWLPGDDREAPGAKPHAVELLGVGQQWVADGIHPGTGLPYGYPLEGDSRSDEAAWADFGTAEVEGVWRDISAALDVLGAEVIGSERAAGAADVPDPETLLAPDQATLAEALEFLVPTGSREWWIAAGVAIKAAGGTVEQWQEVSDRWDGEPEDPEDLARRWAGFRHARVGWRWIEERARGAGWLGSAQRDFGGLDLAALAAESGSGTGPGDGLEEAGATLQERMFRRYVWVEAVERVGDTWAKTLLTRTQFNVRLAEIGPPHDTRKCAWAVFTGDAERRRVVGRLTYRPGQGAIVREEDGDCFNTWRPSALKPKQAVTDEEVAPYRELVQRLFPDPQVRECVLDWLGSLLKHPGEKPAFVLVIGGHEGIGKDSLVVPVVRALGSHNVSNITMAAVMGPNTHWIAQKQLVIITEMHSFSRREVMERLKPIGACPPDMLEVNIKYVAQFDVPNIIAGIYFTNHVDALALSDSDRRHFVAWSPHTNPEAMAPEEKTAFERWFKEVYYPWLDAGGAEAVAGWLMQRDLTAFRKLARAPMTEGKALMRREGRSETVAALEDALEGMDLPDLVSPADLAARLSAGAARGERGVTGYAVGRVLRAMGAVQVSSTSVAVPPTAVANGAKRVRIWALRNETEYRGLSDAALARKYAEMWGATSQDMKQFFTPHLKGDFLTSDEG
jgi:hypothetical protein